jgi:hypothetical protein
MKKGTFLLNDQYFEISIRPDGCSTRKVILQAAHILLNAVTDELECDRISHGRKKELEEIRGFVHRKIYGLDGRPTWLVRYLSDEARKARDVGRKAEVLSFKAPRRPTDDGASN